MTTSDLHQRLLHQLDRVKALNMSSDGTQPRDSVHKPHATRAAGIDAEQPHIPALNDAARDGEQPAAAQDGEIRHEQRQETSKNGSISYEGSGLNVECEISNLTASGARLRLRDDITVPSCFDLAILPENTSKRAQVCWRDDLELGVQFIAAE